MKVYLMLSVKTTISIIYLPILLLSDEAMTSCFRYYYYIQLPTESTICYYLLLSLTSVCYYSNYYCNTHYPEMFKASKLKEKGHKETP
jgi:hypothetical protein